jgi:hypothetical protein
MPTKIKVVAIHYSSVLAWENDRDLDKQTRYAEQGSAGQGRTSVI